MLRTESTFITQEIKSRCMIGNVLTPISIIEVPWPETLIDAAEEIALDNPDECKLMS